MREVRLAAGARFVVMVCGDILTMPGLPAAPAAHAISVTDDGTDHRPFMNGSGGA